MMCDYCTEEKTIMEKSVIGDFNWGWGGPKIKISEPEADRYTLGVFIDRGYLRYVDLDETQCLDHGEKVEIKFCPFCGDKLNP